MAVTVSVNGHVAHMSAASRCAQTDRCFRAPCEQVIGDQDIAGIVPAFFRAGLYPSVAVSHSIADKIYVLGAVRINGEAGIIYTVAVGDDVPENEPAPGIVDRGRRISIVAGKTDGNVACVIKDIADNIDLRGVGRNRDRLGPAGFAVPDRIAEQQDIGNSVPASSHDKYGICAVVFAAGTGCGDIMDVQVADDNMMGAWLKKNGAGIPAMRVADFKSGQLYIAAAIQPEHRRTVLVLIMAAKAGSVKNDFFSRHCRNGDIGVRPALYSAV